MPSIEAPRPYSIEIKENVIYNQLQLADFLIIARDGGLMTELQAIKKFHNIDSDEEAKIILNDIEADQKKRDERLMAQAAAGMSAGAATDDPAAGNAKEQSSEDAKND